MLLKAWGNGDQAALNRLTPLVYAELHRMARRHMRTERENTLQATALVNEAYIRLVDAKGLRAKTGRTSSLSQLRLCAAFWWTRPAHGLPPSEGVMPGRPITSKRSIWTKLLETPDKGAPRFWRWIKRLTTSHAWMHEKRASSNCAFLAA